MGSGYFLYSDQPATITVSGITPTVAPLLALSAGWNLIGLPTVRLGRQPAACWQHHDAGGLRWRQRNGRGAHG